MEGWRGAGVEGCRGGGWVGNGGAGRGAGARDRRAGGGGGSGLCRAGFPPARNGARRPAGPRRGAPGGGGKGADAATPRRLAPRPPPLPPRRCPPWRVAASTLRPGGPAPSPLRETAPAPPKRGRTRGGAAPVAMETEAAPGTAAGDRGFWGRAAGDPALPCASCRQFAGSSPGGRTAPPPHHPALKSRLLQKAFSHYT